MVIERPWGIGFATFIVTPCFPSYPSNHASGKSSGLEVMRRLFGVASHDITIVNTVPPAPVTTPNTTPQLKEIADDVDDARVFGGIHHRFDQEAGGRLGRAVATAVVKHKPASGSSQRLICEINYSPRVQRRFYEDCPCDDSSRQSLLSSQSN